MQPIEPKEGGTVLDKIVILSTRKTKRVLDVPQSISVVTREELDDHDVRGIQDLVRHEPGVTVDRTTSITNPWGSSTASAFVE